MRQGAGTLWDDADGQLCGPSRRVGRSAVDPRATRLARLRELVYAPSAMHKVVDVGALRSEQLAGFFAQSKANVGVLTDMMAIESLKQKEARHYQLSLDVLSRNANPESSVSA